MKNKFRRFFKEHPAIKRFFRYTEHFFAVVGFLWVVYVFCFDVSVIVSGSMSPTLQGEDAESGDWVLTEKITFWFRGPERWEVVAINGVVDTQIMKRVIGLPRETIAIRGSGIMINNNTVKRPEQIRHIEYIPYGKLHNGKTADCHAGYFVLGDDSVDSQDSRFEGPIPSENITGRAWLRIWPPDRWGLVH